MMFQKLKQNRLYTIYKLFNTVSFKSGKITIITQIHDFITRNRRKQKIIYKKIILS